MSTSKKITVYIPDSIVGLVKVDGLSVTYVDEGSQPEVDNWIGIVRRAHPKATFTPVSWQVMLEIPDNDETSALIKNKGTLKKDDDKSVLINEVLKLFNWAEKSNASDIYIDVDETVGDEENGVYTIKLQVDGLIEHEQKNGRSSIGEDLLATIYNVMGRNKERGNWEKTKSAYAVIQDPKYLPPNTGSIRIQTYVAGNGYGATLRLIPKMKDTSGLTANELLAELGYTADIISQLSMLLMRPKGAMLVFGSIGSGKTTSLITFLNILNKWHNGQKRIVTAEDPIESIMSFARQMAVAGLSPGDGSDEQYADAIRVLLRSAPSIGMVSELRGRGTADQFFRMATTGFKALSTSHGNNCIAGIKRLHEEFGLPISYLSDPSIFNGCITQQLLQVLCPDCKIPMSKALKSEETKRDAWLFQRQLDSIFQDDHTIDEDNIFFQKKGGCPNCKNKGYKGRTAVAEVLVSDQLMWAEYARGGWSALESYWKERQSAPSLLKNVLRKVAAGEIDPFYAMREVGALTMCTAEKDLSLSMSEMKEATTLFNQEKPQTKVYPAPVLAFQQEGR